MDDIHDLGALFVNQVQQLKLQTPITLWRDVIFTARRKRRQAWRLVVVSICFFGEGFAHTASTIAFHGLQKKKAHNWRCGLLLFGAAGKN
ncbi:MAG: hypothetical protein V4718_00890 [Pseudomonadota bacterium]